MKGLRTRTRKCPPRLALLTRTRLISGISSDLSSFYVPGGIGIFAIAARFNHACPSVRNVQYVFDDERGVLSLTICQDVVGAGTELRINYGGSPVDLYNTYGFVCACGGCTSLTAEDIRLMREAEYNW